MKYQKNNSQLEIIYKYFCLFDISQNTHLVHSDAKNCQSLLVTFLH